MELSGATVVAAIGAGGKTTLLGKLAQVHREQSVLLTTTTHIYPYGPEVCDRLLVDPTEGELRAALARPGVTCAGCTGPEGKLSALSEDLLELGQQLAQLTLYEGDGSRRHPLKLHRTGEPVLLPHTERCFVVAGLSALGQPIHQAIHRYQLHPAWAEQPEAPVTPDHVLFCVREAMAAGGLPRQRYHVLLNQGDNDPIRQGAGEWVQARLALEGIATSPMSGSCDSRA